MQVYDGRVYKGLPVLEASLASLSVVPIALSESIVPFILKFPAGLVSVWAMLPVVAHIAHLRRRICGLPLLLLLRC